jgi:UDP:flavonoid glycosyltransferase YjiC (YdhE family)
MQITLLAVGSRGDVQPLVALGAGLQHAGYTVRLVAGDDFETLATGYGLNFVPLGVNMQQKLKAATGFFQVLHDITDDVIYASQGADAIVSTIMGVASCQVARERGIPFFLALPIPSLQTGEFPNPLFPRLPFGRGYNRLTYRLSEGGFRRQYPPASCLSEEPRPPYLHFLSPSVVPRPSDWPDFAHITGYWFLDRPTGWQPAADLAAFMETAEPAVFIGFGSMIDPNPEKLKQLLLQALEELVGTRAVIAAAWSGFDPSDLPNRVYVVDTVPYDWLFPRMSAAVHHGGLGTTSIALRFGVPQVTIPYGMDQSFWGHRVAALGAGPEPIPRRKLTPDKLAQAIRKAVNDAAIRTRVKELGERIRAEDGVGNAVNIIEKTLV